MLLKEIGRKIAQAFRLARAADEKVASSIAAAAQNASSLHRVRTQNRK